MPDALVRQGRGEDVLRLVIVEDSEGRQTGLPAGWGRQGAARWGARVDAAPGLPVIHPAF